MLLGDTTGAGHSHDAAVEVPLCWEFGFQLDSFGFQLDSFGFQLDSLVYTYIGQYIYTELRLTLNLLELRIA